MPTAEERLAGIMTASLGMIVVPGEQVCPPEALVERWDLPEGDRAGLVLWGLPADRLMRPDVQQESSPMLVPNVAGEQERRLISAGQRLYRLIDWSSGPVEHWIGAVAGTGRVLTIRPAPMTVDDLHPQMRPYHPGFYAPAVSFASSSVAQFIEVSWRWRAAREVLLTLKWPDPRLFASRTEAKEAFDAHVATVKRCERIILDHIERIDSRVRAEDPDSLWRGIVVDEGYE